MVDQQTGTLQSFKHPFEPVVCVISLLAAHLNSLHACGTLGSVKGGVVDIRCDTGEFATIVNRGLSAFVLTGCRLSGSF